MNNYDFYRLSSDITPWKTEYEWSDLKDIDEIKLWLHSSGTITTTHGIRLIQHILARSMYWYHQTRMWLRTLLKIYLYMVISLI